MDPVTATFLMINGALIAGNGLLWYTDPTRDRKPRPPKTLNLKEDPFVTITPTSTPTFKGSPAQLIARVSDAKLTNVPNDELNIKAELPEINVEEKRTERRLTAVTTRINTVETMLSERLDHVEDRLTENREHIDSVRSNSNAELIERRIETLEKTVGDLEKKTIANPTKLQKLERETTKLKKEIASLKQSPQKKKEEEEIEDLDKSIKALKSKLKKR